MSSLSSLNPPSFTVESTLSSPCSCSDLPLTRQSAALAHLDSLPTHDLVIWTDGSVPFPFGKGGFGVLSNCSLCGTEATLSFSAGAICSSFLLKPAPFCTLFAGLDGTNKSAPSLLSDSRSVLSSIFSFISIFLADLAGTAFFLFLFYQATMGTRTLISPGPGGERYLRPPQSLLVSLLSLVSTLLFSRTGGVLSKFFDTQVSSIFTEELVLLRRARCVLSRLRCNGHSLLLRSYLFRIGRIENPSCSACGHSSKDTSHLILHCPATDSLRRLLFGDSLSLYDFWSRPWRVA